MFFTEFLPLQKSSCDFAEKLKQNMSLETSLLSHIELPTTQIDITIETVRRTHESFMNNGYSVESDKLIEILGGADAILKHYLSSNDHDLSPLSTEQLNSINKLLSSNDHSKPKDKRRIFCVCNENNIESPILLTSPKNTFLHHIIKHEIADKIISFLFGRMMTTIIGLTILTLIIAALLPTFPLTISVILLCSLIPYTLLLLLAMNKTTTKLILQTFEFWFKMDIIRWYICVIIYNERCQHVSTPFVVYPAYTVEMLSVLLFCLLDGLNAPFRMKLSILMLLSVTFSLLAYLLTFTTGTPDACYIDLLSSKLKVDIIGLAAGSARIIAIFAWKQTLYSIFKGPKSTLIKKSVKIIWI